jgi:flagellar biosynthetic protein FliS
MTPTDLAYRTTAAQGASGFGFLVSLYDTLAGNLRRAAAAQRAGNLEKRANELRHALQVVGFLENWIDVDSGDLAQQMIAFYGKARRTIIRAQAKQSAEMLEALMSETLAIRQVWQKMDMRGMASGPEILPPARAPQYGGAAAAFMERKHASWSA